MKRDLPAQDSADKAEDPLDLYAHLPPVSFEDAINSFIPDVHVFVKQPPAFLSCRVAMCVKVPGVDTR